VHKIPPVVLDYFDPRAKAYRRAELKDLLLVASGNALVREETSSSSSTSLTASSSASSEAAKIEYPEESYFRSVINAVSPGTLFMALLAVAVVGTLTAVLLRSRGETVGWSGTSDEAQEEFLTLLRSRCKLPRTSGFEAMRAGIRRSFSNEALAFELLEIVDKLERAHGRPHEALIKHIEALIPALRSMGGS
jgi:hypothetical protein